MRHIMKKTFLLLVLAVSTFIFSCEDSTSPNYGTIEVKSEIINPQVTIQSEKKDNNNHIQTNEVDSIKSLYIRILISEIKLHPTKNDDNNGKLIKDGPFVFSIMNEPNEQIQTSFSHSIEVGSYEKLKFEFHRFSSSELPKYQNDNEFKDFANQNRFSVIIAGKYYKGGKANNFTYNSTVTANLSFNFDTPVEIKEGAKQTLAIQIDPLQFFKKNGDILDPTNPKNISEIENGIKQAIKVVKK